MPNMPLFGLFDKFKIFERPVRVLQLDDTDKIIVFSDVKLRPRRLHIPIRTAVCSQRSFSVCFRKGVSRVGSQSQLQRPAWDEDDLQGAHLFL